MFIQINDSEFEFLVNNCFLKPINDKEYIINVIGKDQETIDIDVTVVFESQDELNIENTLSDIKDNFNKFFSLYPETDSYDNYSVTRSIRNDTGKAFPRYRKLIIEHKFNADDILRALVYDIYIKINDSETQNNLKYLLQTENWLLDVGKIKTNIEASKKDDVKFTEFYNNYVKTGVITKKPVTIYETL